MSSIPPNATPNEMALYNQVQSLTTQLAQISAQLAATHAPAPPSSSGHVKVNSPSEFKGAREGSRPFLGQCELVFSTRPDLYPPGSLAQVNYAASYLRDHAFLWFQSWRTNHPDHVAYLDFKTDFLTAFGETDLKAQSTRELNRLVQKASVATYATTFNRLSANTGLNDEALQFIFNQGLKDEITELLLIHESFVDLPDLQSKAIKIDNRLFNLRQGKKTSSSSRVSPIHHANQRVPRIVLMRGPPWLELTLPSPCKSTPLSLIKIPDLLRQRAELPPFQKKRSSDEGITPCVVTVEKRFAGAFQIFPNVRS